MSVGGNSGEWALILDGVEVGGGPDALGCLNVPPDGLGLPEVRTEDVTYPQRDGVRHFADWYLPRIITAAGVRVCNDDCTGCPSARVKTRAITTAWGRKCDDAELVIVTDCPIGETLVEREFTGPFGVIGRPRVASLRWERSNVGCAEMLLRFDAVDQRMFILDADGTPGSGVQCYTLTPDRTTLCRVYPRCYPLCYTEDTSEPGDGPVDMLVVGNVPALSTITLTGALTAPRIENQSTGQSLTYGGTIGPDDAPVVIDTATGTATQDGASRTNLLTGTTRMQLPVGTNTLRLVSFADGDTGTAEVCYRNAVDSA